MDSHFFISYLDVKYCYNSITNKVPNQIVITTYSPSFGANANKVESYLRTG
jgi:hypothetical protein